MTKGIKFDGEKPDYSLMPPYAEDELAKLLTFGGKKYAPNNWQVVKPKKRYYAAIRRHLTAYMKAVLTKNKEAQYDDESGVHHLICAACNCFFLFEHETVYSVDDPFYGVSDEKDPPLRGLGGKTLPEIVINDDVKKQLEEAVEKFKRKEYQPLVGPTDWQKNIPMYPSIPPFGPTDLQRLYPPYYIGDVLDPKFQTTCDSKNPKQ